MDMRAPRVFRGIPANNRIVATSAGFSLLEILVALTLIALLVGTLVPAVINQVSRGEATRVMDDLRGIENAAKSFRVDVNRWPADLEDLTTAISSTDQTFFAVAYPPGVLSQWKGPYLEGTVVADGGTLGSAGGATILDNFISKSLNGQAYLTIQVSSVESSTMEAISTTIDGNNDLTDGDTGGRVRSAAGNLLYLAAPVP